jgi:hypothetical protein
VRYDPARERSPPARLVTSIQSRGGMFVCFLTLAMASTAAARCLPDAVLLPTVTRLTASLTTTTLAEVTGMLHRRPAEVTSINRALVAAPEVLGLHFLLSVFLILLACLENPWPPCYTNERRPAAWERNKCIPLFRSTLVFRRNRWSRCSSVFEEGTCFLLYLGLPTRAAAPLDSIHPSPLAMTGCFTLRRPEAVRCARFFLLLLRMRATSTSVAQTPHTSCHRLRGMSPECRRAPAFLYTVVDLETSAPGPQPSARTNKREEAPSGKSVTCFRPHLPPRDLPGNSMHSPSSL